MLQNLKNIYHLLQAVIANILFGFPSKKLKVIAITGTDGKTTTSTLIYHILKSAGKKVALISTVAAYIGDEALDTGFHVTTPSPFALQKLLSRVAKSDMEYVVLEVTSHGIDQNRVWGIHPTIAAITNVTHEHLDYHKTFENYLHTKAMLLLRSESAIINADAKDSHEVLKSMLEESKTSFKSVNAHSLPPKIRQSVRERFGHQQYNFENSAIATEIASSLDIPEKDIAQAIEKFPGVPGRMEEVTRKGGIRVIVDFAHTPNALEKALETLRGRGRLIVVFGCAGLRDITKRPIMGEIASRLADLVVLTAEDPRSEDVWSIIAQIKSGVKDGHDKIVSIADREEAITFALTHLAKSGDTVLISGKGHEKSMNIKGTEYPWSDQETVQKVLHI